MKVDYIIVGLGLAGLAFAEELMNVNKNFLVFSVQTNSSSHLYYMNIHVGFGRPNRSRLRCIKD